MEILMLAPGDKRPTWLNGVIQIHITRACDLSCTGCTQGSNLAGRPVVITLENFEAAVQTLANYYGVVGIFGGNPTMHPRFKDICWIASRYIPKERLGLWSNNLNGYGELCRRTFNPSYSNLNVHCSHDAFTEMVRDWPECTPKGLKDSRHSPPFIALDDMDDLTESQKWELIENCDINKYWSAMICQFRGQLRAFFCELAGAQSMLHQDDPMYPDTGIYVNYNWWKLPVDFFQDQIKQHCFKCGIPLRAAGDLAVAGNTEFVSQTHADIFKLKRPANKVIKLIRNVSEIKGFVNKATDYCENGMTQVSI
jgi:hypothetical protein